MTSGRKRPEDVLGQGLFFYHSASDRFPKPTGTSAATGLQVCRYGPTNGWILPCVLRHGILADSTSDPQSGEDHDLSSQSMTILVLFIAAWHDAF